MLLNTGAKHQKGETIVEVLIAIGIVSLVLVSAYATSNKNAQMMRNSREQTQAQKLVEGQIEYLRSYGDPASVDGSCFVNGDVSSDCTVDRAGANVTESFTGASYLINIKSVGNDTYLISASWDKIDGAKGNVSMYYYYAK